jgi:hypothetical protein
MAGYFTNHAPGNRRHTAVLQVIQDMGLELHIVFNRDAVMVLPAGVNKASGMEHALRKLGLSSHEAIGIGDAENDCRTASVRQFW